jgi:nitrogen fixation NifU-like protein
MYSEKVLELFKNPTNVGIIQGASGVGQYINPETADNFKLYIKVEEGKVVESSFKAFSGVVGVALMVTLTEMVKDLPVDDLVKITAKDIAEKIGLIDKEDKYLLDDCVETLAATYKDYQKRLEKEQKAKK